MSQFDLISRTRRGELNFERLAELLETRGYVTEQDCEEGCSFSSTAMEACRQDDFDSLFAVLLPNRLNTISLSCVATDDGGPRGGFSYALFNSNVIEREGILAVLIEENRETERWLASNT
jgi:hypothetical protein